MSAPQGLMDSEWRSPEDPPEMQGPGLMSLPCLVVVGERYPVHMMVAQYWKSSAPNQSGKWYMCNWFYQLKEPPREIPVLYWLPIPAVPGAKEKKISKEDGPAQLALFGTESQV